MPPGICSARIPSLIPPALLFGLALLAVSCSPARQGGDLLVTLLADGSERSILVPASTSVSSLLDQAEVVLGPLDRIEPPLPTVLHDDTRITIVRVLEEDRCQRHPIPFQVVGPGETASAAAQRVQTGLPGEEERCHRIRFEDGIEQDRVEINRVIIREAVDEVWQEDTLTEVEPLSFPGTLVWLSDGNAWLAHGDSSHLRQLTRDGNLDGNVLSLSTDGNRLLYTQRLVEGQKVPDNNALWLMPDPGVPSKVVRLLPENVLHAGWRPGSAVEFAYADSTAKNSVSILRIDPDTGEILSFRELLIPISEDGTQPGIAGFNWSGDGRQLSWVQGDSTGIMDMDGNNVSLSSGATGFGNASAPCASHAPVWSLDSRFVATASPAGLDAPSTLNVIDWKGELQVPLATNVGPCPAPSWAPVRVSGLLAHLQARDPDRPTSRAGHDLMILDRDGSNQKLLFPDAGQPGLEPQQVVWSADARLLALTWQKQLWLIDVVSGEARPFPFSGNITRIEWSG
ncbi:MAG: ubiquitin-like domain-containing protein [Anaerolineaceae bacterium]|nr:ubiquitin-like domain-containing protein [Anaerolineaceae bacterium]MDE0329703.1 ubiquitin-like domain-containing protein [Anaerolineaceae bacterium]